MSVPGLTFLGTKGISVGDECLHDGGAADVIKKVRKEGQIMKLQIVYLPPGELTAYEKNARKHAPDDIEAIKKSILEDGFNDPIGIWGDQNTIVEGHGRQIAALELGLDSVPCIRLDHLTDKQRREYMIRHNRTAELSAWDFSMLEQECAALSIEGQNFEELKFSFDANDNYVDDFFDRGVEAKEKTEVLGVKVICNTQAQVEEVMQMLSDAGFKPEAL